MTKPVSPVGALIKEWRGYRRLSQLDLALQAEMSARHLSFIETGRAKPSREAVLQITDALEVPLKQQNAFLKAAGFSAQYSDSGLTNLAGGPIGRILDLVLDHHAPFPALAIDGAWNLIKANDPLMGIFAHLLDPELLESNIATNVAALTFHPKGLSRWIANWNVAGPQFYQRLKREAAAEPDNKSLKDTLELARLYGLDTQVVTAAHTPDQDLEILVPFDIHHPDFNLKLFSTITTVGTPVDVSLQEIRIETFFPADDATEHYFRQTYGKQ